MSGSKGILSRSLSARQKERARMVAPAGVSGEISSGEKFSRMFKIATRALPEPGGGNVRILNFRYLPRRTGRSSGTGMRFRSTRERSPPRSCMSCMIFSAISPR